MSTPYMKQYIALGLAVVYMCLAAAFVREDRKSHTGGFINLQGMISALATLPVAFPLEYLDHKINFRSNLQMGAAILVCGGLVFGVAFGVMNLGAYLVDRPVPQ
ncbi:MAG: hypothetical protein ABIZ04_06785 [Opitutus sp.]